MATKVVASLGAGRKPSKAPPSKGANPNENAVMELVQQQLAKLTESAISELQRSQQHVLGEFEKLRQAIEERKLLSGIGEVWLSESAELVTEPGRIGVFIPFPAPTQARGATSSTSNRARTELDLTVNHLRGEGIEGTDEHWESLARDSESRRVAWTMDGSLVKTQDLARKWGRSRQALDQSVKRGELFNLKVGGRRWYPAVFVRITADQVKQVNLALGTGDPVSKFVFWNRPHGGLGGMTAESAIREGKLARVVELAEGWAEERGWETGILSASFERRGRHRKASRRAGADQITNTGANPLPGMRKFVACPRYRRAAVSRISPSYT